MKKIAHQLLLISCFISISNFSLAIEKIPEFIIKSRSIQPNTDNDSALLVFKFFNGETLYKNQVQFGINNESFAIALNENGTFTTKIKNGTYKLYFFIGGYREVITDSIKIKSKEKIVADIHFYIDINVKPAKPVIYVYPEKETKVSIQLNVIGQLGFTYPTYNDGWNFVAHPNGNIQMNDKSYNYLFWESEMPKSDLKYEKTGFLLSSDTLLSFLENSLNQFGLNSKESADFITYWYPQMIKNKQNHIHFLFNDACDTYAELNITPVPKNIFRIGMLWSEAETNFIPEKQNITSVHRNGFTVIEWGGVEMHNLFEKEN